MKKYITGSVILIIVFILIPIIFENYVLGYNPGSRTTADAWAGFFGGYLGAIIGAFATIIAVITQMNYNEKQTKSEEEKQFRPFLYLVITEWKHTTPPKQTIDIHNVGLHTACNIEYGAFSKGNEVIKSAHINILNSNRHVKWEANIYSFEQQESFYLYFYDILGNRYKQRIKVGYENRQLEYFESPKIYFKDFVSEVPEKCN